MAVAHIVGPGGNFAAPSGFNGSFENWDAAIDLGPVDNTGFGDNGWNWTDITSAKLTGSAAGVAVFNDTNASPASATLLASTLAPAAAAGSFTLTMTTGCTWAFTGVVTNIGLSRSAKPGTRGDHTLSFENQGAVTQTWDETA